MAKKTVKNGMSRNIRQFPEIPSDKPRNLRPSACQGCGCSIGGVGGMTFIHGKWLCINCLDREKKKN